MLQSESPYISQQQNYGSAYPQGQQDDLEWKQAPTNPENDSYEPEIMMRLGFIRKVFGIISAQIVLTGIFIYLSCSSPSFAKFQHESPILLGFTLILSLITCICISCSRYLSRTFPYNYLLLFVFTLCESYSVGFICTMYSHEVVLLAAFMTSGITVGLTIYALTTKKDLTMLGGTLFILLICLIFFGIGCLFTQNRVINLIYSVCGAGLFGIYLIYDVQLLIGNKQESIDMDDYIFGSMSIYLDIINIFLHILKILGKEGK